MVTDGPSTPARIPVSEPSFSDARILVVDDQQANVILLERMLARWGYGNVVTTTDSSRVASLCAEAAPDLILLDLQMPPPDGFQLLEMLTPLTGYRDFLPVIVLAADLTEEAIHRALAAGAKDFITKPFDPVETSLRISNMLETRRLHLELRRHNEDLEARVEERTRDLDLARIEVLERLALAAEYRDDQTHEHAQRVGRTTALLAAELELPVEDLRLMRLAAPLHDIGKIGIPDEFLRPGKLSPAEFALVTRHTVIGSEILTRSSSEHLQMAEVIARSHHERWDGSGYPDGLAAEAIPLPGRLVALADVFDALTHDRPYKSAWTLEQAVTEIRQIAGTQLDPAVVEAFDALDHAALLEPVEPALLEAQGTASQTQPRTSSSRTEGVQSSKQSTRMRATGS